MSYIYKIVWNLDVNLWLCEFVFQGGDDSGKHPEEERMEVNQLVAVSLWENKKNH